VLAEHRGHLPVRGTGPDRHHGGGHDIPHVCMHGLSLARPPRGPEET
jgi:hypothetical protein